MWYIAGFSLFFASESTVIQHIIITFLIMKDQQHFQFHKIIALIIEP